MKDQREKELFENTPVSKAILRLALPTVAGQIVLVIYNLADTFFIGLTGSDAKLTAVTVCMPAFMLLSAIANLFGIGGGSVMSRALGRGDRRRAGNTASFAFWGGLAVTATYSFFVWTLRNPLINLLGGQDPIVHGYSEGYLLATVVLGGAATSLSMLFSHLIRAEGRAVAASFGIGLGGVCNILLDPLFMFVIFPKGSEVLGAAVATGLSNMISLVYFFAVFFTLRRRGTALSLKLTRESFRNDIPLHVLSGGLPACLMTFMENVSYAVLDKLMSCWGPAMQAGIGVAKKVNMLAHCIVRGIAQGSLPLIAYNFAAGDTQRAKRSVLTAGAFAIVAASVCTAFSLIFCHPLVRLFIRSGSDAAVWGARFLCILCLGAPFSAWAYTVITFFQAVGQGLKSFLLAVSRKGVIDIPLMFILNPIFPARGIVWATPLADFICCAAACAMFLSFTREHGVCEDEKAGDHPPSVFSRCETHKRGEVI